MRVSEFNKLKQFSEGSGVIAAVDPNITMILNEYGIYEEVANTKEDINLTPLIEKVSPNFNKDLDETVIADNLFGNINEIKFDDRLGYYSSLYVGYVKEGDYREKASSGGLGTWIFEELFKKKLIDKVIHVKEVVDSNDNRLFKYDVSYSIEEIKEGSKTKYYPVELSEVIEIVKNEPGNYAVIGIPSFIMAIRLLAKADEVINERIKFTIGIICGHQKSSKFTASLANQMDIKPEEITDIDYRKKIDGLPANRYAVEIKGIKNGKKFVKTQLFKDFLEENWGQGLFKVRASDFTDDVFNETADITLGDAWLPQYTGESMGNNVVIVRNEIIDNLLKDAIIEDRLKMDSVDNETIFQSQSSHYKHTHDEIAYRLSKLEEKNEMYPKKRLAASNEIDPFRKAIQDLREELSTESHILYKKSEDLNDYNYYKMNVEKLKRKYLREYKIHRIKQLGVKGASKKVIERITKLLNK